MKEIAYKIRQKFLDRLINFYGPYVGAGVKLVHMSKDFREARVEMPLTIYNRNYVGTQFGGSLYAMTDPWYMLMLIKNLGNDYIVWDKGATIDFKRPGRTRVRANFTLTQELIDEIKAEVDKKVKVYWPFKVEILDDNNEVVATVDKIVYVRKKSEITKNNQTAK